MKACAKTDKAVFCHNQNPNVIPLAGEKGVVIKPQFAVLLLINKVVHILVNFLNGDNCKMCLNVFTAKCHHGDTHYHLYSSLEGKYRKDCGRFL